MAANAINHPGAKKKEGAGRACLVMPLAAPPITSAGAPDSLSRIREGAAISMPPGFQKSARKITNGCECHKPPGSKKRKREPGRRAACIPVARQSARTRRLISVEKQNIVPDVDA